MENIINIVERINAYASFMPKKARWQAEYMMNKLVQSEDIEAGLVVLGFVALLIMRRKYNPNQLNS